MIGKLLLCIMCLAVVTWYPPNGRPLERYENVKVEWHLTDSKSPQVCFVTAEGKRIFLCGIWKVEE